MAFAFSYTLHDHPVKSVMVAADQGKLRTRADVERIFRNLYNDPKILRGGIAANSGSNVW